MIALTKRVYLLLIPTILVVLTDEWLKFTGLHRLPQEGSLVKPGLITFAIHKNWGIAFDIPFKLELVVLISVLIGLWLIRVAYRHWNDRPGITFAAIMIMIGALGNLFDRVRYGFTVDYIILFGHSAINLSDIVIVLGVLLLLLSSQRKKFDKASEMR
ncbi:signal peptidase II [Candidatus Uhrbacteria bacterium]|nr:signal peptidase II [Candidatus Uhrbacteria bacterium]